ncbi:hypothetical protein [Candidatus Nitrospira bockiana]
MHMVMMVFRTSFEDEVLRLIEEERLAYTRIDNVQGKGATGTVPGSVTWGGANTILFIAVPDDRLPGLRARIGRFEGELEGRRKAVGVPFHVFVLPCEQWV